MRKIVVALTKGGVGKTTTAVNLSAGLAASGFHTLLIDTDTPVTYTHLTLPTILLV